MVKIQKGINYIEQGETLKTLLSDDTPYILYFTASWCGPCRMISPEFERLKQNYPDIAFYKIDIDECEELASMFSIRSVPTFFMYKKKREYYDKCEGANTQRLSELLFSLQNLYINKEENTTKTLGSIKEEEIEPLIDNNLIYYNNMDNLGNYETIEPIEPIEHIEPIETEHITIQKESDLDKFFETMKIDTNTETYDVKPSDINVLNL